MAGMVVWTGWVGYTDLLGVADVVSKEIYTLYECQEVMVIFRDEKRRFIYLTELEVRLRYRQLNQVFHVKLNYIE